MVRYRHRNGSKREYAKGNLFGADGTCRDKDARTYVRREKDFVRREKVQRRSIGLRSENDKDNEDNVKRYRKQNRNRSQREL